MRRKTWFDIKSQDLNKLARKGFFFCASCGKQLPRHNSSGHCASCLRKGVG